LTSETTFGREPITIVEIDQDFCSLTYGISPCEAVLGTTGSIKCFNTLRTCQDPVNFDKETLTLKFCTPTSRMPKGENLIPSVVSVSTRPTEINIAAGDTNAQPLGRRASVTVTFKDHPYSDRLVDKYLADRTYNPNQVGTFWSKWLRRNPYYQNRIIRIREGYVGQNLSDMRTRHYVIDNINGPDSSGSVRLVAKDILKLADDKKAQCPVANTGEIENDISDTAGSLVLVPTGIGNEEYPASGTIRVSDELMTFTRSGDTLTLTQRGVQNTEASNHSAGDTVQVVKKFTNTRVDSIVKELLEDFANIDSSFIPFTEWEDEADTWLAGYLLNATITEPTGVNKLLSELVEQAGFYIWWDEIQQEIKFQAVRPRTEEESIPLITDESNIIADSVLIERDSKQRLSQIQFYFDQINPVEQLDEASNFRRLRVQVDTDAERDIEYGEKRIKTIYSRWYTNANDGEVLTISTRFLLRYRDNPLYFTFSADAKERLNLWTGDVFEVQHRNLVDNTGQPLRILMQIISVIEKEAGHMLEYRCQQFGFGGRFAYVVANGTDTYDNLTDEEKSFGGWIAPNSGIFDDGGEAYKII